MERYALYGEDSKYATLLSGYRFSPPRKLNFPGHIGIPWRARRIRSTCGRLVVLWPKALIRVINRLSKVIGKKYSYNIALEVHSYVCCTPLFNQSTLLGTGCTYFINGCSRNLRTLDVNLAWLMEDAATQRFRVKRYLEDNQTAMFVRDPATVLVDR
ncbi:hypothetical protein J6590_048784 [Homalodisca vitripennis]|nr:hypothetical protein J6590_048784 [Homalodisca vitripennis]